MSDITPAAQELADEKGIDLSSIQGSGKDGRVLLEDVEAAIEAQEAEAEAAEEAMEAEDPAEDAEVVGEVGGDPLVVSQPTPETSVETFKSHPHVPVTEQTEEELKDFIPESLETVEGTPEAAEAEAEAEDIEENVQAPPEAEEEAVEPGDDEVSQDDWLNRTEGLASPIPEQVNPNSAWAAELAGNDEAAQIADEDIPERERPAMQTGVVNTSAGDDAPTAGDSLLRKSPAVEEVVGEAGPGYRTVPAENAGDVEGRPEPSEDSGEEE
jgi:hypothetical protein